MRMFIAALYRRHAMGLIAASLAAVGLVLWIPLPAASEPAPDTITVTLLGTGNPEPEPGRFSASTLVEAGGMRFLFDAGRGAAIRLYQLGVPLGSLKAVFLSHLHSDHVVGLPDVWLMGFINPAFGARKGQLDVVGPQGTANLVEHLSLAYEADVKIRIEDQAVDPANTRMTAREFDGDGVVFEKDGVKITAFTVDHGEHVKPAVGYRIDYRGRSVLLSGDTRFDSNVVKMGQGVDLLVHEVAEAPQASKSIPWVKDILAHHVTAQEAGRVFSLTKPKMAAYTHLVLLRVPQLPPVSVGELEAETRKTYQGPLVVGEDLTRFIVGSSVRVQYWDAARGAYSNAR